MIFATDRPSRGPHDSAVLANRAAIVTGSGRGIGRSIAIALAREGAAVVVNDIDGAAAAETGEIIGKLGARSVSVAADIVRPETAGILIDTAMDNFGSLDILVNNAGYTNQSPIEAMSKRQYDEMIDIHLIATIRLLRRAGTEFRRQARADAATGIERYRKVVNVSSLGATRGVTDNCNYAVGKGAVIGLTRALAAEWAADRVNVNCVAFGMIATRLTAPREEVKIGDRRVIMGMAEDRATAIAANAPLGRAGRADEAARAVLMLCLPGSDYIGGQIIEVAGGI